MYRALLAMAASLLSMTVGSAATLPTVASDASKIVVRGPTYRYSLKEGQHTGVCTHMLRVFNDRFTHLWDAPPMPWSKNDRTYSAASKYSFPLLPGVKRSTRSTFEMRFSAQPTSPEFSAIHWKEGMGTPGGCPAGAVCPGEEPEPILISHLDFDNDGTTDTVVQQQFFGGYRLARDSQEYLMVWRSQVLKIHGIADIGKLIHPKNPVLTPIIALGMYFRPFIYAGRTYVAQYVQDLNESGRVFRSWTQAPDREDMLVQQYSFNVKGEGSTERPKWNVDTICDFQMKQVSNR